jgi:hypothetical protein
MSFDDEEAYALYSTFQIGDESSKYQLTVAGYSGTAGIYVLRSFVASHTAKSICIKDKV